MQRRIIPDTSLMRAHSTGFPWVIFRTRSRRLRSQRSTWPSEDAESKVLKDLETAKVVTAILWPNRHAFGVKSNVLGEDTSAQTDIVQSVPAVIKVLESANVAQESCP